MNSCVVLSFCLVLGLAGTQVSGQINCTASPCKNNQACIEQGKYSHCFCKGPFYGKHCERIGTNECTNEAGRVNCFKIGEVRCFKNGIEYCACPKWKRPYIHQCQYRQPPPPPKTPTEEEKQNSVLIEMLNTDVIEWDDVFNAYFERYIANDLANKYCVNNKGRCGFPYELEERIGMHKRFNGTYLSRQAHRLPGYPKQKGRDVLCAFYILNPPVSGAVKVLPAAVVVEILNVNRKLISEWVKGFKLLSQKAELGKVRALHVSSPPKSGTSKTRQWSVIGVAMSVSTLLLVLVVIG